MNDRPKDGQGGKAGLCGSCLHARTVVTDRGSRFVRCDRAATDSAYARYPILPVRVCRGYEPGRFQ